MDIVALIVELLFLLLGIGIYLFAKGRIQYKKPKAQQQWEEFRVQNKSWMKILSLILIAIMTVEIALHIYQMTGVN